MQAVAFVFPEYWTLAFTAFLGFGVGLLVGHLFHREKARKEHIAYGAGWAGIAGAVVLWLFVRSTWLHGELLKETAEGSTRTFLHTVLQHPFSATLVGAALFAFAEQVIQRTATRAGQ